MYNISQKSSLTDQIGKQQINESLARKWTAMTYHVLLRQPTGVRRLSPFLMCVVHSPTQIILWRKMKTWYLCQGGADGRSWQKMVVKGTLGRLSAGGERRDNCKENGSTYVFACCSLLCLFCRANLQFSLLSHWSSKKVEIGEFLEHLCRLPHPEQQLKWDPQELPF